MVMSLSLVQEPVEKTITDIKPMAKKAPKPAEKKKTANHKSKSAGNRSVTKKSANFVGTVLFKERRALSRLFVVC